MNKTHFVWALICAALIGVIAYQSGVFRGYRGYVVPADFKKGDWLPPETETELHEIY
jgi:hypothetical protein